MDEKQFNLRSMVDTPTNRNTMNTTLFSPSPVPPVFSVHGKAGDFNDDLFTPSPTPPVFSSHGKAGDFNDDLFTATTKSKGDVGSVSDLKTKLRPDSVLTDVGRPLKTWSKRSKLLIAFAIFVVIIVALCVYLAVAVVNGQDESGDSNAESGPVVVQGIDNGELFFMCWFTISSTDNLLYKVTWYQNDVQMYVTDFASTSELPKLRLTETIFADNSNGFQLGTEISCDVLSYFQENSTLSSESNRSSGFFVGLQIMTPSLTFVCDDHININARTIVLKQTIPLTCPGEDDCEIEPKVSTSEDVQGRCPKIGIQEKTCAAKLLSENEVGSNIEVIVTCPSDEQYMQNDGFYQVYLITTATSGIWANYVLDPINVHILPPANQVIYGKRCESKNDPHMVSGDQKPYELQRNKHSAGTFILYRNKAMKAEVQVRFSPCYMYSNPLCNSAVAVQFGQDVYVIAVSSGTMSFGYKACGDRLLRVQSTNELEYKIFFPYGTYVQVRLGNRWRFLSYVYVHLSSDDYGDDDNGHKTSGLCGPVNDDQSDDFTGRDGGVQPEVEFIESWRVTDNKLNMLEDTFDLSTLEAMDWNVCVCTDNPLSPQNIIVCGSNPAAECSRGNDVQQHDCPVLIPTKRKKRSTEQLYKLPVVRVPQAEKPQSSEAVWTVDNATEYCNNFFSASELYAKCSDVPNARPFYARDDCILDIMLSGGTEWTNVAKSNMEAACLGELDRNQTLSEPQDSGTSLAQDIQAIACPGDCSGSGTCVAGACICNSGFGGADCSILTSDSIDIAGLLNDGICDEHVTVCDIAWVRGYPMTLSDQLVCRLEEFTESIDGTRHSLTPTTVPGIFSTIIEAGCPLPTAALPGYFYRGYKLSISNNNGETVSEEREVIIYNSACQKISTDTSGNVDVKLMDDRCFIEGSCRYNGDENGNDTCYKCLPQLSKWSWTRIFHPECPGKTAIIHGNPPHIETFDEKQYATRKEGWFYLMFDPSGVYQIIGEFVKGNRRSYLNAMTIVYGTHTYYLGQNLELKVDGIIETTPYFTSEEINIFKTPADDRLTAILGNGITTSWDGKNTTHISVPLSFWNNTHAMCGTYNENKADDFTKPNGQVTDKKSIFVESWAIP